MKMRIIVRDAEGDEVETTVKPFRPISEDFLVRLRTLGWTK